MRDVQFLHNEQFFAAAQKKYVYIYDKRGLEVHCLRVRLGRMFMSWNDGCNVNKIRVGCLGGREGLHCSGQQQ